MENETAEKAVKKHFDSANKTKIYYQAHKKNTKKNVRLLQKSFRNKNMSDGNGKWKIEYMKNYYCNRKKCCIAYLIVLTICKMFALVGKFLSSGIFEIRKIQKDSEF